MACAFALRIVDRRSPAGSAFHARGPGNGAGAIVKRQVMARSSLLNKKPIIQYLASRIGTDAARCDVLDLGIGVGDFGKLIKKNITAPTRITGVEAWEKYRGRKWSYYDEIVIADIQTFLAQSDQTFDFVLLVDVLEHFSREDGENVLNALKQRARRAVIVSTPTTGYPQGATTGNPYQEHRCIWSTHDLRATGFKEIYSATIPTFALCPLLARLSVHVFEPSPQAGRSANSRPLACEKTA